MTYLHATILGVIEGVTEFLPISSTGHLILAGKLLGLGTSEFFKTFEIAIQLGAVAAAAGLYWRTLLFNRRIVYHLALAFLPTAVVGAICTLSIKTYLLGNSSVVIAALFIGGVGLIWFENFYMKKIGPAAKTLEQVTTRDSIFIGLSQSLALIPGLSRAACTIVGGQILGFSRQAVVEFSFLLAIPTMLAATVLDIFQTWGTYDSSEIQVLGLGFLVSLLTAGICIKLFLKYIETHNFTAFGVYRIIASLSFFLFFF